MAMKTETKKNLVAASLYVTLAVMIVTVVCVTVVSVAQKARNVLPEESTPTEQPTEAPPAAPSVLPTEPVEQEEPTEPPTEPVDAPAADPLPDKFVVPSMGYISKAYEADLPVWSVTMNDYRIHDGIDVSCAVDSEVYACASGTVESVYEDPLMGYALTLYHGGGLRSTYLNLSDKYPDNIAVGAEVAAGQVIGYVGESALVECAEPSHLHFVMTMDEQTVDPLSYVDYETAVLSDGIEFED